MKVQYVDGSGLDLYCVFFCMPYRSAVTQTASLEIGVMCNEATFLCMNPASTWALIYIYNSDVNAVKSSRIEIHLRIKKRKELASKLMVKRGESCEKHVRIDEAFNLNKQTWIAKVRHFSLGSYQKLRNSCCCIFFQADFMTTSTTDDMNCDLTGAREPLRDRPMVAFYPPKQA